MRESMKRHLVSASLGLATAVLLVLLVEAAFGQPAPVPIQPRSRAQAPQAPAQPGELDWRPILRPAADAALQAGPPARLRYYPLPPGSVSCSLAPGGRQDCGPGVWLTEREDSR
jgi:hypothetical protein